MLFFISKRSSFFTFLSLKTIKSELELLKKEVIIQWKVWKKDLFLLANKLIEKVTNSRNAKELYQSFIGKKHKTS